MWNGGSTVLMAPRDHRSVHVRGRETRAQRGWELQWRGAIVVILCLVVWLLTRRDKGLPP
jgi:hypothetical protein